MVKGNLACATAVFGILCLAQAATAQSGSSTLSRKDLRRLERGAQTAEQYRELASYFRAREYGYRKQADAEMEEWTRRMQFYASLYAKYPAPADSSRNRYEYFKYEQRQMDLKAGHYEKLAATALR